MEEKICVICGKGYLPDKRNYGRQLTCSKKCATRKDTINTTKRERSLRKDVFKNCVVCGKEFLVHCRNPRQIYCSSGCLAKANYVHAVESGRKKLYAKAYYEKHKQEVLRKNEIRKNLQRYGGKRKEALERDDFKCQLCGSFEELCVHHKDFNKENNKLDNFQTLCRMCHAKLHSLNVPERKCSIEGCDQKHYGLGFCRKHYRKLK